MITINDQEPIVDSKGNIIYQNELDRVKSTYGFHPPTPYGLDLDPEERSRRQWTRHKNKINKAK